MNSTPEPGPLFDFTTEEQRPFIRIDGEPYALARPDDLSLSARHEFNELWARVLELEGLRQPTKEERRSLRNLRRRKKLDPEEEAELERLEEVRLPTDRESREYQSRCRRLAELVLIDCPTDAIDGLKTAKQQMVVVAFFAEAAKTHPTWELTMRMAAHIAMTNAEPSPDSRPPTTEIPSVG